MFVLLKIEADKPLPVPEIAPPGEMRVGQWTIAVGRTFEGNRPNMSVGILSARTASGARRSRPTPPSRRTTTAGRWWTSAAACSGVLVPLSPMETSEVAGVEWYDSGIGFAVPAQTVMEILPRLKQGEDLLPGRVGISIPAQSLYTGEPVIAAVPAALARLPGRIEGRRPDRGGRRP